MKPTYLQLEAAISEVLVAVGVVPNGVSVPVAVKVWQLFNPAASKPAAVANTAAPVIYQPTKQ